MARKPHARLTAPETLLQRVIGVLDSDDSALADPDPARVLNALRPYHAVFVDLLKQGPLLCEAAVTREQSQTDALPLQPTEVSTLRAELVELLRKTVGHSYGGMVPGWIDTYRKDLRFSTRIVNGRVRMVADGDSRTLVILQMVLLLDAVGVAQVRECRAPDCRRIFLKVYRREFCSERCQRRINARIQRQQQRDQRALRARRRRRQAG